MNDRRLDRRLGRRMTHRSRSAAASIALVLVALGAAFAGVEAVLALLGQPALVARPGGLFASLGSGSAIGAVAGAVALLLGIVALLSALLPGRRPRRVIHRDEVLVVVDDDVLASSLSRAAADGASIPRDQVRTLLSRGRARIRMQPSSGFPFEPAEPLRRARTQLDALRTRPALRPRVEVATGGRLR